MKVDGFLFWPSVTYFHYITSDNRAENLARKAAGEDPLPEEDPSNPIFKPLPEPSRLDSFLITNQISNYCNQINGYVIRFLCLADSVNHLLAT